MIKDMPEYFLALVSQYTAAINPEQAQRYSKSVISAWYFSSNAETQSKLRKLLPAYLLPQNRLFHSMRKPKTNPNQDLVYNTRLLTELSVTDQKEINHITSGVFRSLKVISSQKNKFAYAELIEGSKLKSIFIKS